MNRIPTNININLSGSEQAMSPEAYLLSYKQTVMLCGVIDTDMAEKTISEMYALDDVIEGKDIYLIINSPGGSVSHGMAIIDAMNYIKSDVVTVCTGEAASMAAIILACGTKGKRFITPYAEVLLHQPLGGVQGQASDISRMCEHMLGKKDDVIEILSKTTGNSKDKIITDIDRDYWLKARAAIEYGIVDGYWQKG